jgi:hypothetical protein
MKPTQEQVIAWAREAGIKFDPRWGTCYTGNSQLEIAFTLAYEAGRKDENEACALAAEAVVPRHTECGNKIAAAIRARGQG